jgi:hypothetical protein
LFNTVAGKQLKLRLEMYPWVVITPFGYSP